jgi:hypothetical protein
VTQTAGDVGAQFVRAGEYDVRVAVLLGDAGGSERRVAERRERGVEGRRPTETDESGIERIVR